MVTCRGPETLSLCWLWAILGPCESGISPNPPGSLSLPVPSASTPKSYSYFSKKIPASSLSALSPFSQICLFFIIVLLFWTLPYLKFCLLTTLSFLLPSIILSFILYSFHCELPSPLSLPSPCDCFSMIKFHLYMQHHCLFKVTSVQNTFELSIHLSILLSVFWKKFNVILLTLQYHLVQTMPFHLTIAILLSASMQSLQTMPVLNASRHWPILQWQTILASLSQTTPILQFHSSSSKIPFFPKFMVFSNLLSSSNPLAMNPPFSGQHVCCTSPFFPGFKPYIYDQVSNITSTSCLRCPCCSALHSAAIE